MIKLENLTKAFETPSGTVIAADRINMDVADGEICVLLGPSGCGKTTTLKMINRLVEPTSGKIYIDGKDTDQYDPVELRRTIGYVIQQIGLFPNMTVEDNVCVVPKLLGWDMARAQAGKRAPFDNQPRPGDLPQALSEGTVGRPAAACGRRARARRRSARAADGRTVWCDRSDQP